MSGPDVGSSKPDNDRLLESKQDYYTFDTCASTSMQGWPLLSKEGLRELLSRRESVKSVQSVVTYELLTQRRYLRRLQEQYRTLLQSQKSTAFDGETQRLAQLEHEVETKTDLIDYEEMQTAVYRHIINRERQGVQQGQYAIASAKIQLANVINVYSAAGNTHAFIQNEKDKRKYTQTAIEAEHTEAHQHKQQIISGLQHCEDLNGLMRDINMQSEVRAETIRLFYLKKNKLCESIKQLQERRCYYVTLVDRLRVYESVLQQLALKRRHESEEDRERRLLAAVHTQSIITQHHESLDRFKHLKQQYLELSEELRQLKAQEGSVPRQRRLAGILDKAEYNLNAPSKPYLAGCRELARFRSLLEPKLALVKTIIIALTHFLFKLHKSPQQQTTGSWEHLEKLTTFSFLDVANELPQLSQILLYLEQKLTLLYTSVGTEVQHMKILESDLARLHITDKFVACLPDKGMEGCYAVLRQFLDREISESKGRDMARSVCQTMTDRYSVPRGIAGRDLPLLASRMRIIPKERLSPGDFQFEDLSPTQTSNLPSSRRPPSVSKYVYEFDMLSFNDSIFRYFAKPKREGAVSVEQDGKMQVNKQCNEDNEFNTSTSLKFNASRNKLRLKLELRRNSRACPNPQERLALSTSKRDSQALGLKDCPSNISQIPSKRSPEAHLATYATLETLHKLSKNVRDKAAQSVFRCPSGTVLDPKSPPNCVHALLSMKKKREGESQAIETLRSTYSSPKLMLQSLPLSSRLRRLSQQRSTVCRDPVIPILQKRVNNLKSLFELSKNPRQCFSALDNYKTLEELNDSPPAPFSPSSSVIRIDKTTAAGLKQLLSPSALFPRGCGNTQRQVAQTANKSRLVLSQIFGSPKGVLQIPEKARSSREQKIGSKHKILSGRNK